jgi:hypothetical protein
MYGYISVKLKSSGLFDTRISKGGGYENYCLLKHDVFCHPEDGHTVVLRAASSYQSTLQPHVTFHKHIPVNLRNDKLAFSVQVFSATALC